MSILEETVKSLREGDKVRVDFQGKDGWAAEGIVRIASSGSIFLGPLRVSHSDRAPLDAVLSVEILERAKQPFYMNQPADREPRIGDVWSDEYDHADYDLLVFTGRLWFKLNAGGTPQPGWDIKPGQGRLVDPSELEAS